MAESLETPICPLCRSPRRHSAYPRFDPYQVVRCRECGFYYLCPRLEETAMLAHYRDDAYYRGEEVGYADYDLQVEALRATFRRFLARLEDRGLSGGELLEVGCGFGLLLEEAAGQFSRRVGTDFSEAACEVARARAEEVYLGGVEEVPVGENGRRFRCIVATQVIEHVYDPIAFVNRLVERLEVGGSLVLATPDMGNFWRHLMGHRWPSFKLPEHVLYFDAGSLKRLLEMAGLEAVAEIPYPHAFPLTLVASKLRVPLPRACDRINVWLPKTTVALYGVLCREPQGR